MGAGWASGCPGGASLQPEISIARRLAAWTMAGRWWYRKRHSRGYLMAVQNDPLKLGYNRWERFLNQVSGSDGEDREVDQLSEKMVAIKAKALSDGVLTQAEVGEIHDKMEVVAQAYVA